jgi:NAD(P)-dependent dehydrogenase (short-subunit alcohol dehydrogenase family)
VAEELAAEGAAVAICARGRAGAGRSVPRHVCAAAGAVHGIEADVSVSGEPARVVAEATKIFGAPDIVVTNPAGRDRVPSAR